MNIIKKLILEYGFTPVELSEILVTNNVSPETLYTLLLEYGFTKKTIGYFSPDHIEEMQATITKYNDTSLISNNVIRLACEQCNIDYITSLGYVFLVAEPPSTTVKYIKHVPKELQAIKQYNESLYNAVIQIATVTGPL